MARSVNGSRPIQRLAKALRPPPPPSEWNVELAAALQDCLDEAARKGAREVRDELIPRLDKQDATLRMVWRQCGGRADERLPIDD